MATACSASYYPHQHHSVSTQHHAQDGHGGYVYGYANDLSQKHEAKNHGSVQGSYSYIDGYGHQQSVHYTADPHHGFQASGTNFPVAPVAHHGHIAAPVYHYTQAGPIETPEVQHAKAAHFAAHAEANARLYHQGHHHGVYKRSVFYGPAQHHGFAPLPVNGVPVDTPEVAQLKAAHLAEHSKALAQAHVSPAHYGAHYDNGHNDDGQYRHAQYDDGQYRHAQYEHQDYHHGEVKRYQGPIHIPVIQNGVPVETPEVQHAKAAHYAAVQKATSYSNSYPSHHSYPNHHY